MARNRISCWRREIQAQMERLTFGIEIEFSGGLAQARAAEQTARQLHASGTAAEYQGRTSGRGYNSHHFTIGADRRRWEFVSDASISSRDTEFVSPVLTLADMDRLQAAVRAMRAAGGRSDDDCGIHVHVGSCNLSAKQLSQLCAICANAEPLIAGMLPANDDRGSYCRPLMDDYSWPREADAIRRCMGRSARVSHEAFWTAWYGCEPNRYQSIAGQIADRRSNHYDDTRYRWLNLHSYASDRQTVEFRMFNSTLHAGKVRAYVTLCLALVARVLVLSKWSAPKRQNTKADAAKFVRWLRISDRNVQAHLLSALGMQAFGAQYRPEQHDQPVAETPDVDLPGVTAQRSAVAGVGQLASEIGGHDHCYSLISIDRDLRVAVYESDRQDSDGDYHYLVAVPTEHEDTADRCGYGATEVASNHTASLAGFMVFAHYGQHDGRASDIFENACAAIREEREREEREREEREREEREREEQATALELASCDNDHRPHYAPDVPTYHWRDGDERTGVLLYSSAEFDCDGDLTWLVAIPESLPLTRNATGAHASPNNWGAPALNGCYAWQGYWEATARDRFATAVIEATRELEEQAGEILQPVPPRPATDCDEQTTLPEPAALDAGDPAPNHSRERCAISGVTLDHNDRSEASEFRITVPADFRAELIAACAETANDRQVWTTSAGRHYCDAFTYSIADQIYTVADRLVSEHRQADRDMAEEQAGPGLDWRVSSRCLSAPVTTEQASDPLVGSCYRVTVPADSAAVLSGACETIGIGNRDLDRLADGRISVRVFVADLADRIYSLACERLAAVAS